MRLLPALLRLLLLLAGGSGVLPVLARAQDPKDDTSILFLKIPTVQGASRFDQLATEAPASVSVVNGRLPARRWFRS